jgi:hypothetical protein
MGCLIEADEGARKLEFLRWISPVGAFSDECGLQELWQSSPCGKRLGGACPTLEKRNSASGQLADGNDDMRHRYPGNDWHSGDVCQNLDRNLDRGFSMLKLRKEN